MGLARGIGSQNVRPRRGQAASSVTMSSPTAHNTGGRAVGLGGAHGGRSRWEGAATAVDGTGTEPACSGQPPEPSSQARACQVVFRRVGSLFTSKPSSLGTVVI